MNDISQIPFKENPVIVLCFTYNQSQYVEDALNGFAMQQTNFPFVCLVMDDCSTDGEQEVIKAYLDRECDMKRAEYFEDDTTTMTLVPHRTNVNCTFAVYLLKKNLYRVEEAKMVYVNPWRERCEYEALCEGDDYWTDPYKLQKQVDFLENHEEFSMCFSSARTLREDCTYDDEYYSFPEREYLPFELLQKWIPTHSVLYRSCLSTKIAHSNKVVHGDIFLFLQLAFMGKVYGSSSYFGVYRIHEGSVSRTMNKDQTEKLVAQYRYMHSFFVDKLVRVEIKRKLSQFTMIQIYNKWYSPFQSLILMLRNRFCYKDESRNYLSLFYTYVVKPLLRNNKR